MSVLARAFDKGFARNIPKSVSFYSSNSERIQEDEFRVLNFKATRNQNLQAKRKGYKPNVLPPRTTQMPVDQDWGSVWPGPRSFHPATVPLPIRQGYREKGAAPDKYANAELMKIPNFLHLTPPVVKRQCEALKKFCTPWPKALDTDEKCEKYFPIEVTFSNYCHSSPTIRDPLARIVTLKIKLSTLKLNEHARDKFLRLVGDRYDEKTDTFSIVTDRCPTRKQNYEYAMYLLTAVYHESWEVEPWEKLKSEVDMEVYDWNNSKSKETIEELFKKEAKDVENINEYVSAINSLMNEGESKDTIYNYGLAVRKLFNFPVTAT
ncbi:Mitochondrial ribosomal subunit protein [Popillia japonica]|uniref:Mitochondrial ribosomal subunit protein n=1 Tax=Popillia japonica TaxID=7064 RepID=A0AAW1LX67_POPJA